MFLLFVYFSWFILAIYLLFSVVFFLCFLLFAFLCSGYFHCFHVCYRTASFFTSFCVTSTPWPPVTVKIGPLEQNGQYSYQLLALSTGFPSQIYLFHINLGINSNSFYKQYQYLYFHKPQAAHSSSGRNRNFSYISHEYGRCSISTIRLTPHRLANFHTNSTLRLLQWITFFDSFSLDLPFDDYPIVLLYWPHVTTTK
jgi:hypothetical protein